MSKTRPFGADRCPNCGEYGPHFVPPSLGESGFFHCKKKSENYKDRAEQCPYCNQKTFNNPCGHCGKLRLNKARVERRRNNDVLPPSM